MRVLFFLLLKLIEITGVLVAVGIATVVIRISFRYKAPAWLVWVIGIGGLLFLASIFVYANWIQAGDWADKWRERRRERGQ